MRRVIRIQSLLDSVEVDLNEWCSSLIYGAGVSGWLVPVVLSRDRWAVEQGEIYVFGDELFDVGVDEAVVLGDLLADAFERLFVVERDALFEVVGYG